MNYPAQECDIWWHLQIGENFLKEHRWPSPDYYSYVSGGREWVVHSWLADCIFYVLYSIFGFNGLTLFRYFTHFILTYGVFRICMSGRLKPANSQSYAHRMEDPCKFGKEHEPVRYESSTTRNNNGRIDAVSRYDYLDENGELLIQVCRMNPKRFFQRRPDGARDWIMSLETGE
ncbi:MAG: hypothetical protein ACE15F_14235 [bacterium]